MYVNPYERVRTSDGCWLKANFHAHAGTEKDPHDVEQLISEYFKAGYEVLTISNQWVLTDASAYQAKYGVVMINGIEYAEKGQELLCIGTDKFLSGPHQKVIDECAAQGGFTIIPHPNYSTKGWWPLERALGLTGYIGVEILNPVIYRLQGSGLATDWWDDHLSQGGLIWGFANDDFHTWYDFARAWNVVFSTGKSREEVLTAVRQGCFYASTGLVLDEFLFQDGLLSLSASVGTSYVKTNRYVFIGSGGRILHQEDGSLGRYHFEGHELYVRVQVISEHGATLWTQPIYDSTMLHLP